MDTLGSRITAQTEEELRVNLYVPHNVNLIKRDPRLSGGSGLLNVNWLPNSVVLKLQEDRISANGGMLAAQFNSIVYL